ncbi:MAG TPA: hypothetical protein VHC68_02645 [Candidatus Paceibacterota bacterium]|nr:hypothetical protein [Candidatus Paceibacterota bacterium]
MEAALSAIDLEESKAVLARAKKLAGRIEAAKRDLFIKKRALLNSLVSMLQVAFWFQTPPALRYHRIEVKSGGGYPMFVHDGGRIEHHLRTYTGVDQFMDPGFGGGSGGCIALEVCRGCVPIIEKFLERCSKDTRSAEDMANMKNILKQIWSLPARFEELAA